MNIAGKTLDWFNRPNQQLAGEIISNLIPEPSDLPGILQKRDDELYELYKQRTNPQSPGDPLAPPIELARANTANPHSTFIRDPGGSGKLIKFNFPLDLRSVEQKMQGHPFNQMRMF